jgi:hypothetical protein
MRIAMLVTSTAAAAIMVLSLQATTARADTAPGENDSGSGWCGHKWVDGSNQHSFAWADDMGCHSGDHGAAMAGLCNVHTALGADGCFP